MLCAASDLRTPGCLPSGFLTAFFPTDFSATARPGFAQDAVLKGSPGQSLI